MSYSADEVRQILACLANPEDVAGVALAAFAGFRSTELARLKRTDVREDKIFIRADKSGQDRCIPVLDLLRVWLMPLLNSSRFLARGLPSPAAIARHSKAQGLTVEFRRLRRSFVAYRFAATGDLALTAAEAGIAQPVFRRTIPISHREEAAKFWALTPEACGRADWEESVQTWLKAQSHGRTAAGRGTPGRSVAQPEGGKRGPTWPAK
jgi:integrase